MIIVITIIITINVIVYYAMQGRFDLWNAYLNENCSARLYGVSIFYIFSSAKVFYLCYPVSAGGCDSHTRCVHTTPPQTKNAALVVIIRLHNSIVVYIHYSCIICTHYTYFIKRPTAIMERDTCVGCFVVYITTFFVDITCT